MHSHPKFLRASLPPLFSQGGCGDARILEEEPRKNRKSRGSGGFENTFSAGKGERKKRREDKKTASKNRMEEKMAGKRANSCANSLAEIKYNNFSGDTHDSLSLATVLFTVGRKKYDYPMTKEELDAAIGLSEKLI